MRKLIAALAGVLTLSMGAAAPQVSSAADVKIVVGPHSTRIVTGRHHWQGRYYKYRQWRCYRRDGRRI